MPAVRSERYVVTRRSIVAAAMGAGLGAVVASCTGWSAAGAHSSRSGARSIGTWTFTDDRNARVTLSAAPVRVVAYTGTAAALHDYGVGAGTAGPIVGIFGPAAAAAGLDVSKLTVLSDAGDALDVGKYAALRPDLVIADLRRTDALRYLPAPAGGTGGATTPRIGLAPAGCTLPQALDRHAELAGLLGADVSGAAVAAAQAGFEQAAASLRAAVQENSGVSVLAATATPDGLRAADPAAHPDLAYYRSLGLRFAASAPGADLILLCTPPAARPDAPAALSTWAALPAAKEDHVIPWRSQLRYSHSACTPQLEALAAAVRGAKRAA
jgi:iron complex transport system substrate-binding protein